MQATYIPYLFVLLWATGFVSAKWGLPYAEPFTFLSLRMLLVVPLFALLAITMKRPRLNAEQRRQQMITGIGTHGLYLGGVFYAIAAGMPAGIVALIVGVQPLLTALVSWPLGIGSPLRPLQWIGVMLGLAGLGVVVLQGGKLSGHITGAGLTASIIALLGISGATLWQSVKGGKTDLISGGLWQYIAALIMFLIAAFTLETREVQWNPNFIGAWMWSVFVLSLAAVLLWLYMLKIGEATKVTQYLYLTPPTTAVMAYLLFDEPLTLQTGLGVALVVAGLYLARRGAIARKPALSKA
ncbi:DMT family transporter [Hahella sp. HN01]|uniref:DMT family transporter n=1 Tax=unclassified Hahella TaxID=2624107 RepID=UPI001C1EA85D|nr:DMT family transporter [Hahella sp. HN01]MBU6953896.1 DMT family transporter [Hahella sp. HN01]